MSGFAVVYEASGAPVQPGVLERVMMRLEHRGPDGYDVSARGNVSMGHWHFWTTPEEVGEKQPTEISGLPFRIVMDGRLDNREDLMRSLRLRTIDKEPLSDAALVLHAYDAWGENCFEHFIGEFAIVIDDVQRGELLCGRDALGDRTLFYSFKGKRLVIASEPWGVAGADDIDPSFNDTVAACHFALRSAPDGQTWFKGIDELLPAHVLVVNGSSRRMVRYWQPDLALRLRGRSDEDYAEEFRSLLQESVRCRMRACTPVGVLMSGGLDSTSVACLAARLTGNSPLTTISYVFDELTECDERKYIDMVREQWGIHSIQVPCDDAWTYKDWQTWPKATNQPEGNPFRLLKERAYPRASQAGLRVLLTGGFGDQLYGAGKDWLADLIADGQLRRAGRDLAFCIRTAGWRWTLQAGFMQHAARHLLNAFPGGRHLHRRQTSLPWLTPYSAELIAGSRTATEPGFERYGYILGRRTADSSTWEITNASRHAVDLRHPYRDRRLVEFVLKLPAYQLNQRGQYKHVLRIAMRQILPEPIRTRRRPTSVQTLYDCGIERENAFVRSSLQDAGAGWSKYLRMDWVKDHWSTLFLADQEGTNKLAPWLCISYETWYKYHTGKMELL